MSDTGWTSLEIDDDLVFMARQTMAHFTCPGQRASLLAGLDRQEVAANLTFVKTFGASDIDFSPEEDGGVPLDTDI